MEVLGAPPGLSQKTSFPVMVPPLDNSGTLDPCLPWLSFLFLLKLGVTEAAVNDLKGGIVGEGTGVPVSLSDHSGNCSVGPVADDPKNLPTVRLLHHGTAS